MQARTLERLRWLSVVCLVSAAVGFMLVERRAHAFDNDTAHFPSPGPGVPVRAIVDVPITTRYVVQLDLPSPVRDDALPSDLPPQPAGLRVSIRSDQGAANTVDIREFAFWSASARSGIASYSSAPFRVPAGRQEIEVSSMDGRLPAGRALSFVESGDVSGFFVVQDVMRFLGWASLALGAALWSALAFACRYAASDASH